MPERRVSDIVSQATRLNQCNESGRILIVQPSEFVVDHSLRNPPADASHLERMRESTSNSSVLGECEDLGLVLKSSKCAGVDDAGTVARGFLIDVTTRHRRSGVFVAVVSDKAFVRSYRV